MKTGIYIHVPFCRKKCSYCDFYSDIGNRNLMEAYGENIIEDFTRAANEDSISSIETIYFGGGTPSLLLPSQVEQILQPMKPYLTRDGEITLEMNPEDVTRSYITEVVSHGINRIVLGVQNCDEEALKTIGRRYVPCQPLMDEFFDLGGFDKGVDIITGIPGQSNESLLETVRRVTDYGVSHISLYLLTLKEGTPLYSRLVEDDAFFQHQEEQFFIVKDFLQEKGYIHYEVSNFALPGCQALHNTRYWDLRPYHGFGPSAHSYVNNRRYWCDMSIQEYVSLRPVRYTCDDRTWKSTLVEYVMTSLRLLEGFSFSRYREVTGKDLPEELLERLHEDARIEVLKREKGEVFRVKREAVLHIDAIAYDLCEPWIE